MGYEFQHSIGLGLRSVALGLLFAFILRLGAQTNEIPIPTEEIELHDRGANCCGPIASLHLFLFS